MVFTTVELSKILVKERILGKRRNNQSMNYEHSLRVYARLKKYTSDEEVLLAGLLHDILEDSDTTSSELKDL
jgi:(p)ppGpp synthase/HD superfamily hydrolase